MRLIDADALIEQFDEYIECNRDHDAYANNWCADVCEVLRDTIVKVAPTIEARPVARGEWIAEMFPNIWDDDYVDICYKCSECGAGSSGVSPFCPNCGAEMRTKEEE